MSNLRILLTLLIKTKVLWIIIATIVITAGVRFAMNEYAKNTYLKEFYKQTVVAAQHAKELTFPNLVLQTKFDGTGRPAKMSLLPSAVQNCSVAGTYKDGATGKVTYNTRRCEMGYFSYYWLSELTAGTIDSTIATMRTLGWQPQDYGSQERGWLREELVGNHESLRGVSFTRPDDDTLATVTFLNRNGQAIGQPTHDWCGGDNSCQTLMDTDKVHQYFLNVYVYAFRDFQ